LIFLALAYQPQYQKVSRLIKGITLQHVLYACYVLSAGAGACLNPALGFAQTIYWVGLAHTDGLDYDATLIWVYMTMPIVGAILAYAVFDFYLDTTKKFEVKPAPSIEDESQLGNRRNPMMPGGPPQPAHGGAGDEKYSQLAQNINNTVYSQRTLIEEEFKE
jgi:hypothetical protein